MQNAGLDEAQAGIKIAGRNINDLKYEDDTTLRAESKDELWEGLGPQDAFKKDSRGLSWVGVETLISLDLYRGP